nr:tripartite motif-containing protein 43-like [Equus caballus]
MDSNVFQNQFTCSMCMNYFIDPVTIGCGHSFCMPCLCICWEGAQHPPRCPVCREISHQTNFKTNIILRTQVFLARRARPYQFLSSAEQMCEIHLKTKNFFCEVIKDFLCLLCCKSKEHVAHRHCSIDWIAEEYRQELLKQMRFVWEKTQENQRNRNREIRKIRTWEGYVTLRRKMIRTEYQKVCQLLYKEEKHHLERIEKESREILQQLKESEDSMDLKGKLLRGMYEELKEMCHKPDMELLRHFENILKRSESVQLHMPQPVDSQLSSWPITGLIDRLNRSQGNRQLFGGTAANSPLLSLLPLLHEDPVGSSTLCIFGERTEGGPAQPRGHWWRAGRREQQGGPKASLLPSFTLSVCSPLPQRLQSQGTQLGLAPGLSGQSDLVTLLPRRALEPLCLTERAAAGKERGGWEPSVVETEASAFLVVFAQRWSFSM